jgi:hypothetical protein
VFEPLSRDSWNWSRLRLTFSGRLLAPPWSKCVRDEIDADGQLGTANALIVSDRWGGHVVTSLAQSAATLGVVRVEALLDQLSPAQRVVAHDS